MMEEDWVAEVTVDIKGPFVVKYKIFTAKVILWWAATWILLSCATS